MSDNRLVFLSGRIDGISLDNSSGWRKTANMFLWDKGYNTYDPTAKIDDNYSATPNEVFMNDTYYLKKADVVLVNLNIPEDIKSQDSPFFTIGEMFLANNAGKPIITFGSCYRGRPGYEAIVTKNLDNLEKSLNYISTHY